MVWVTERQQRDTQGRDDMTKLRRQKAITISGDLLVHALSQLISVPDGTRCISVVRAQANQGRDQMSAQDTGGPAYPEEWDCSNSPDTLTEETIETMYAKEAPPRGILPQGQGHLKFQGRG